VEDGELGCVFIDTVNAANVLPGLGRVECCNPCGEQFLHSGDACNLDAEKLAEVTRVAVRLLDNVVDLTAFLVP
jgi:ribonucleoside-diphosphate reductase alpha chain